MFIVKIRDSLFILVTGVIICNIEIEKKQKKNKNKT